MIITSPLFEAYLDCKTKCWLRAQAKRGAGNAYADWVRLKGESYYEEACKHLVAMFPENARAIAPHISMKTKNLVWRVATDVRLQTNRLESRAVGLVVKCRIYPNTILQLQQRPVLVIEGLRIGGVVDTGIHLDVGTIRTVHGGVHADVLREIVLLEIDLYLYAFADRITVIGMLIGI